MFKISDTHYVNLDNASHIKLDKKNTRIIIIYNYSIKNKKITSKSGNMKVISDYDYVQCQNYDELAETWNYLVSECTKEPYMRHISLNQDVIINLNAVTSIKVKERYVIVNFNNGITYSDCYSGDETQLTSQFIYLDAHSEDELSTILNTLIQN